MAKDRLNLIMDISTVLSATKTWVTNMSARTTNDGFAFITIEVGVSDSTQLSTVRRRLEQVSGVLRVTRRRKIFDFSANWFCSPPHKMIRRGRCLHRPAQI